MSVHQEALLCSSEIRMFPFCAYYFHYIIVDLWITLRILCLPPGFSTVFLGKISAVIFGRGLNLDYVQEAKIKPNYILTNVMLLKCASFKTKWEKKSDSEEAGRRRSHNVG